MNLRELLKQNQATTETKQVEVMGAKAKVRRLAMSESAEYQQRMQSDPVDATLYLLKTVVLDDNGHPYFTSEDDEIIRGALDRTLSDLIRQFWAFQNGTGEETDDKGKS